ncbi:hypothetical protein QNI16_28470 [Cytophagaceae bacterium YF14B1]|uniref:GHMP kinase N-terminal domain-containing protein n=1 Tax=Xanthocytophaga flava TaxID=3048013 RepID=A0AAE3QWF8_9BACT|nr:hypothetical protein [Xanthocytophaga flavus]MDJ1484466.1 hypothetical protein [Xanthocytophaga flavus]
MSVHTKVYAKPGELIQGMLPDGTRFLVSNKSSQLFYTSTTIRSHDKNAVLNPLKPKTCQAIHVFYDYLAKDTYIYKQQIVHIQQSSNIPQGKGLSSSSADILGVLSALNLFYQTNYTAEILYQLAVQVDPTDPCLHEGNIVFDSSQGAVIKSLNELPYCILYFDTDFDSTVDTISFGRSVHYSEVQMQKYEEIIQNLQRAFKNQDYTLLYECTQLSAQINNQILPKPGFDLLNEFAQANDCGIFVAHSGTYMGLIMDLVTFQQIHKKAIAWIKKHWNTTIYSEYL